ncbi:hypothetical protein [Rhodopirellula bahusiensis]|uniref:DNA methyltransferase n=1 Tax=Rhodopirellula bahusiensis TaxID=2014065 RepID=A0A2G1VZK7_9BACT|nr:hypothetical protein [Rhodopirellula bahusiensis]PHQ32212.1 hypothetical protein CEE69_26660 [Rhodopirellula bahusiensis]
MEFLPLIIQLITGAGGGNAAAKLVKKLDLGIVGNSIAGIIGGGLGGQLLSMLGITAAPSGAMDLSAILGSVASGGVGGGALLAIIGVIKNALASGQTQQSES